MNNNKQTIPEVNPSKRFLALAELLLEVMIEGNEFSEGLPNDFKMPKDAINKTANELEAAFNKGELEEGDNKMFYYSGMTDDFGGNYEIEIEKAKTVKHHSLPWKKFIPIVITESPLTKRDSNLINTINISEHEENKANKAFILRAVNNHYQLLETLENLIYDVRSDDANIAESLEYAENVIKAVKNAEQ